MTAATLVDAVAAAVGDVFRARPGEWLTRSQVDGLITGVEYSRSTLERAFNVAFGDLVIEEHLADSGRFRLVEGRHPGDIRHLRRRAEGLA